MTNALMDGVKITGLLKGNVDHKDMDNTYVMNKARNDAQLLDKMDKTRETRKEL